MVADGDVVAVVDEGVGRQLEGAGGEEKMDVAGVDGEPRGRSEVVGEEGADEEVVAVGEERRRWWEEEGKREVLIVGAGMGAVAVRWLRGCMCGCCCSSSLSTSIAHAPCSSM